MLKSLALALETRQLNVNALPPTPSRWQKITFVWEGERGARANTSRPHPGQLGDAYDCKMLVDLDQRLCFPQEIITTTLQPDLVLWSASLRHVYIIKLTVTWESSVEEAYERKKLRYVELTSDAQQRGWMVKIQPVEVGCQRFVATLTSRLLREMGVQRQAHWQAIKDLSRAAKKEVSGCG